MMLATLAREYEIVNRKRVRRVVLQPGTRKGQYISNKRFASQTKPMQDCHPERSEGSLAGQRSFAPLRMTKRDGLLFEMYCPLRVPGETYMINNPVFGPLLAEGKTKQIYTYPDDD